jgi:hypothetical protein
MGASAIDNGRWSFDVTKNLWLAVKPFAQHSVGCRRKGNEMALADFATIGLTHEETATCEESGPTYQALIADGDAKQ